MITIREITRWEEGLLDRLAPLLPQLSQRMQRPNEALCHLVVESEESHLLVAECAGEVVGMLTVAFYPTLTALRGWIEDVVVDERARRQGVGRALLRRATEIAREQGCATLSLTSAPHRKAAHALYLNEHFEPISTQLFRRTEMDEMGCAKCTTTPSKKS